MTLVLPATLTNERCLELVARGLELDIAQLDLEMVKMKLRDVDEGEGWSSEQCESAELEYKRFLQLNRKYASATIVPNRVMDVMWHYHILDTRQYVADSDRLFGRYFHHFPYFGMRGPEDEMQLRSSFMTTQQIYEREFSEPMVRDEAQGCWHDCSGRCWHACSSATPL